MRWRWPPAQVALAITMVGLLIAGELTRAALSSPVAPLESGPWHSVVIPSAPATRAPGAIGPGLVIPSEAPDPTPTPAPTPRPTLARVGRSESGVASWYCLAGRSRCTRGHPSGLYAAIRRDLLGELRGRLVDVCAGARCVRVRVIDCNCGPSANLIDLYADAFRALGIPLSRGVARVTVSW